MSSADSGSSGIRFILSDRNNTSSADKLCESEKQKTLPRRWSEIPYNGEKRVPQGIDPTAGSWPLFILGRNQSGQFTTPCGRVIDFELQNPNNFDFDQQLLVVQQTLRNLTEKQRTIAEYWGDGPPTKQWTPIIDRLIDTYGFTPVRAARVLTAVQGGINDAFVVTWFYKYLFDVARPVQLDRSLVTAICTPYFPSYPSGHSVMSGTAQIILSYFFPPEAERLRELAEEASISRLYGGVHFPVDLTEGLRMGRQIGRIVVDFLSSQRDINQNMVDIPIEKDRNADLPPPPYKQLIPFPPIYNDCDLPLLPDNSNGGCFK